MNILLDIYYDNNFGDDIMGHSLIQYLLKHGHTCFVIKRDEFTFPYYMDNYPVKYLDKISAKSLQENKITAYIKIGGSMFPHGTLKEGLIRYYLLYQFKKIKKQGILILIINCNIGPLLSKIGQKATKKLFSYTDFFTCRDKEAYHFIQAKNRKKGFCLPDLVYGITLEDFKPASKEFIGISVYMGYASYLSQANEQYCLFISELINEYHKTNKKQIFKFFVFDTGYNSDFPATYKILNKINNKNLIQIVPYNSDINFFLREINSCKFMIGTRFHSIVIALRYNIPVLPIIYSNKTENMLSDLGYTGKKIYMNQCSKEKISAIIELFENPNLCICKITPTYLEESKFHFEKLNQFLNSAHKK